MYIDDRVQALPGDHNKYNWTPGCFEHQVVKTPFNPRYFLTLHPNYMLIASVGHRFKDEGKTLVQRWSFLFIGHLR